MLDRHAAQPEDPRGGLFSKSFLGLLVTQFLGATNDNIFRWLVVGIGKDFFPESAGSLLSAGLACFVLPYLILASPAGYLADRFSKRRVIIGLKLAEIGIMSAGVGAVILGHVPLLFGIVLLAGVHSALFGPSKLGSIPELVRPEKISAANGLVGLTTVMATVIGSVVGNLLADRTDWTDPLGGGNLWTAAAVLVGVATAGWVASLFIVRVPAANPTLAFPWRLFSGTWRDLRTLFGRRALFRVALGTMFFWSVGSLANMTIDQFGFEGGLTEQRQIAPLLAALVIGVGLGSVLAGIWSGGKVELGILPLGAGGIMVSSLLLFTVSGDLGAAGAELTGSFRWACLWLFTLGLSAGMFDVPLTSYLQHESPRESRGAILAAANFVTFAGMLAAAGSFSLMRGPWGPGGGPLVEAREIFLVCGLLTIPVFIYIVCLLPGATLRFVVWLASHTVYRVRVFGRENLPERGGALLVPNHVTWIDGVLLLITSSRPIRMLIFADYVEKGFGRWLGTIMGVIPIKSAAKRRDLLQALETARQALRDGELVCIFPEGALTRTGQLQEFRPGLLKIVEGTGAPVIPVYLDELWGSIFSFHGGKFIWKWPRRWPYPVSILFGRPIQDADNVHQVRQQVQALGSEAAARRSARRLALPRRFLRSCRRKLFQLKVSDSGGAALTGGKLLLMSLVFRRLLRRNVLADDERFVGLLLPPSVGGVVANAALPLMGRVPVNLNYTTSAAVINSCIRQCGIKHVLTSRKLMHRLKLELDAEVVYAEDFRDQVRWYDKAIAAFSAYVLPAWILERLLGITGIKGDDLLTVIFTSGSTGEPKGVMLSYDNIGSNVEAIDEVVQLKPHDVALGVLPFFHSFGFTATLWTVLSLDPQGAYHFNPLDANEIAKLCQQRGVTIIMVAPTFLRGYLRRIDAEQLKSLEVVVAGAEKLPMDLADAFEKKFNVRPVEGYGTTELSPIVAVNVPPGRAWGGSQPSAKEGSVGRPVPGVSAKIVDPDSGSELGPDQPGMLLIKGPNVMQGYFNKPELTAQVIRDGWYTTGDIAQIDAQGFITITGRQSRFSKLGGEMVPHITVEEAINRALGADDELKAVVAAVPDPKKGERLVVLHLAIDKTPDEISRALTAAGLPNLWIPSPDSFRQVDEIPLLGTGKLDLKRLQAMAQAEFLAKVVA